jgi:quercetin dioxygenase-like cupin family protein
MSAGLLSKVGLRLWTFTAILLVGALAVVAGQPTPARRTSTGTSSARPDPAQLQVNRVQRDAGGRSFWHTHQQGQVFYSEEGRCVLQERGGRVVEVKKGDEPVFTPSNVEHWHGAAPDEACVYVAVGCCTDNYVKWLDEEVVDQVYKAKAIRRQEANATDLKARGNK